MLPSTVKFEALPGSITSPTMIATACGNSLPEQKNDAKLATSLEVGETPDQFEVSFSSKGIPEVEPGVVNWLYLSSQDGERVAVIMTSAGAGYRWHQGQVAKEQVMLAMRIAGGKLNRVQALVQAQPAGVKP